MLGSSGAHVPVEDVNLDMGGVLTADYEFQQGSILYNIADVSPAGKSKRSYDRGIR